MSTRPAPPGLQAERTALSWTRTCLGLSANGFLLLLRDRHPSRGGELLAAVALVLAVGVVVLARRRTRQLRSVPDGGRARAGPEITALALGVTCLAVGSGLVLVVSGSL